MSARILVVDDIALNLKLLAARLGREYFVVETAASGKEALAKVAEQLPDLILLDVQMPEMDGFEVCMKLRADPRTRHVPVVMVTALTDISDRLNGLRAGADDFISKPINEVALLARVRSLLRLKFLMDEWRLREQAAQQFGATLDPEAEIDANNVAGARVLYFSEDAREHERLTPALAIEQVRLDQVTTADEIVPLLSTQGEGGYEVAMLALRPGDDTPLQLIARLRAADTTRNLPIVIVADDVDMARVARALELGASDYIMRPVDTNELVARLRTQIRHARTYARLRGSYERSLSMALTDPLTGAFNRRYAELHLPRLFNRARTGQQQLSALYLDLDHFKQVNDKHGHPAGDAVLKELVNRLNQNLRSFDLVVRMGGEEFAVIMPETDAATAAMIGERLCHRVADVPFDLSPQSLQLPLTVSIGVAALTDDDRSGEGMLARADQALYRAKQGGRNRVEVATESN